MKYLRENKILLIKYLMIIIFNTIIYVLSNYYFRDYEYGSIIMFIIIVISGLIIYKYKEKLRFKIYLDIICCFITGLLLYIFIDDAIMYSYYLFNIFFANNIVFMISRKSEKIFIRGLQYLSIIFITILAMFLDLLFFLLIQGI